MKQKNILPWIYNIKIDNKNSDNNSNKNIKNIGLFYDYDQTLSDKFHPNIIFEENNIDPNKFWNDLKNREKNKKIDISKDDISDYINLIIEYIKNGILPKLSINDLKEYGKKLSKNYYKGLEEYFQNIGTEFNNKKLSHNIITSGLQQILEGSSITKYIDSINGFKVKETNGIITGIEKKLNSYDKPKIIEEIIKKNNIESKNIIYFGDGLTDQYAFEYVNDNNGLTVLIIDENNKHYNKDTINKLIKKTKVQFKPDYSKKNPLYQYIKKYIKKL